MKTLLPLFLLTFLLTACGGSEGREIDSDEAIAEEAGTMTTEASSQYLVDPVASKVIWEGTKLTGSGHTGELPVENGQLIVTNADNRLVAGQFALDLRKMTNTDLPADKAAMLIEHLQDPEFFDVEKYPMINFDLIRIEPAEGQEYSHELTGNLTMKGKERSVTLPANVAIDNGRLTANTPKFTIDRNDWGVSYGNSLLESAKDKIISDEIGLQISLIANKE